MNTTDFEPIEKLNYITFEGKVINTKDVTAKNGNTYEYYTILVNHNGVAKTISYPAKMLIQNTNVHQDPPLVQLDTQAIYQFHGIITQNEDGYLKASSLLIVQKIK